MNGFRGSPSACSSLSSKACGGGGGGGGVRRSFALLCELPVKHRRLGLQKGQIRSELGEFKGELV